MEHLFAAIIELILGVFKADKSLSQESRYGESPEQRESRRSCQFSCLVLFLIVVVVGLAWRWWK